MSGKVTLVGAGPGDPGLLTRKGERALREAEVVVYDRLVDDSLLALASPEAEYIYVGKASARHTLPQGKINELLLCRARAGKRVVRLKGGDPFLFGRGGEELDALVQHGIPFEVVPGVTSAIAAPAYAGIPVTHREYASSLHIITGHPKAGAEPDIPFSHLVKAGGTLVFLMGVASLGAICRGLLEAGMAADTPAAVVENGTLPSQRKVVSTLAALPGEAQAAALHSPAVIVVGAVAALQERYDWFSRLPLLGRRVVVTRPATEAQGLAERLRALGCEVLACPCIETRPRSAVPELEEALHDLGRFTWLAFTSAAGVEAFWDALWNAGLDGRALAGLSLAAIGPGTARALERHGLRVDYVPEVYDTAHLAEGLAQRANGTVLLPRSAIGTAQLGDILRARGVSFQEIPVYDTVFLSEAAPKLEAWLREGDCYVTFTSASTVRGFAERVGPGTDLSGVTGLCIGAQTAAEAERHGIRTRTAQEATIDGLVKLILETR